MRQFAIYMVGLLVVLAAVYVLLTMTGVSAVVPVGILAVVLLVLLGIGIMRASHTVPRDDHVTTTREVHGTAPRGEVVERRYGDTEIRRRELP